MTIKGQALTDIMAEFSTSLKGKDEQSHPILVTLVINENEWSWKLFVDGVSN